MKIVAIHEISRNYLKNPEKFQKIHKISRNCNCIHIKRMRVLLPIMFVLAIQQQLKNFKHGQTAEQCQQKTVLIEF